MYTWGKPKTANFPNTGWVHSDPEWKTKAPVCPPLLNLHHPPILEDSTCLTKKYCSSKYYTQCNTLPSDLLHTIDMVHLGLVHCNNFKPVLAQITQQNPLLRSNMSYKLMYVSFGYFISYKVIQYVWVDRHPAPHTPVHDHPWGKYSQSNTILSKRHMTHHDSSISNSSTLLCPCLPKNDVPTYVLFSTNIPFLPHISGIPYSLIFFISRLT